MIKPLALCLAVLALCARADLLAAQLPPASDDASVVLLIRHAEEEEDGSNDPPLSDAGRRRAERLVAILAKVPLQNVYSSPYKRTRETAGPIASAHGLTVQDYDPQQLPAFAAKLAQAKGVHLVVGHSNTTPQLARALRADPGTPIAENEHGRLYMIVIEASEVQTLMLKLPQR